MQSNVNAIISVLVLVFFIPATLGFALIDHHCSGCQSHDKETVILLGAHNHNDATCFCTESAASQESHECDQHAEDCDGENEPVKHSHDCVIELKKLEEPFTPVSFDDWLPMPLEITFAKLFFAQDQIPPASFLANGSFLALTPPRIWTGFERLIMNEVFRL